MANLPKNIRILSGARVTVVHYQVGEKFLTYEFNEELDENLKVSLIDKKEFETLFQSKDINNELLLLKSECGKEVN